MARLIIVLLNYYNFITAQRAGAARRADYNYLRIIYLQIIYNLIFCNPLRGAKDRYNFIII